MSHTYGVICSTCGDHVSEPGDCPEGCEDQHGYTFVSGDAMSYHECPPCECLPYDGPLVECPIHGMACDQPGCYKNGGPHGPCHDAIAHKCQWFKSGKCIECGMPNPLVEIHFDDWTSEQKNKAFDDFNEKFLGFKKQTIEVTFKTPNPAIIEMMTGMKVERDQTKPLTEQYPEYKKGLDID